MLHFYIYFMILLLDDAVTRSEGGCWSGIHCCISEIYFGIVCRRRVTTNDRLGGGCSRQRCGKCISYLIVDDAVTLRVWLHRRDHSSMQC